MSKTYKRNSNFIPKKGGKPFIKDKPWKKKKKKQEVDNSVTFYEGNFPEETNNTIQI